MRCSNNEIEKMKEEMSKMKLQDATKPGFAKASSVYKKPKQGDELVSDQFKRSQSRGKLIKGSFYNARPAGMYRQQIIDYKNDLENSTKTMMQQNIEIHELTATY